MNLKKLADSNWHNPESQDGWSTTSQIAKGLGCHVSGNPYIYCVVESDQDNEDVMGTLYKNLSSKLKYREDGPHRIIIQNN